MTQNNRLSNREWEVVELLLQGKSNKLIAGALGISVRTVEFHLKNIYTKFFGLFCRFRETYRVLPDTDRD